MAKNIEIRNSTAEFLIFLLEGKEDGIQVMYKRQCTHRYTNTNCARNQQFLGHLPVEKSAKRSRKSFWKGKNEAG